VDAQRLIAEANKAAKDARIRDFVRGVKVDLSDVDDIVTAVQQTAAPITQAEGLVDDEARKVEVDVAAIYKGALGYENRMQLVTNAFEEGYLFKAHVAARHAEMFIKTFVNQATQRKAEILTFRDEYNKDLGLEDAENWEKSMQRKIAELEKKALTEVADHKLREAANSKEASLKVAMLMVMIYCLVTDFSFGTLFVFGAIYLLGTSGHLAFIDGYFRGTVKFDSISGAIPSVGRLLIEKQFEGFQKKTQ